jgi:hypothetical protein
MRRRNGRAKLDALLRHLGCGHDLHDFPGTTRYEQLALIQTAGRRGYVEWEHERGRYELTPVGWRALAPRRGFGVASLVASTAIGATIAATALVMLWSQAGVSRGQSATSAARLETPVAAPASRAAGARAPAAVARDPVPGVTPGSPVEPQTADLQPTPEQPSVEDVPTVVKPAAVKKTHHKPAGTRPSWAFANPYRDDRYPTAGRLFR